MKNQPPFTDARLREAIHLTINRDETANPLRPSVLGGHNVPAAVGGAWGISEEELKAMPGYRQPKAQDIARARELVAAVVAAVGKLPNFKLPTYTPIDETATILQAQLAKIGVNLDIQVMTYTAHAESLVKGTFDMTPFGLGIQIDDPTVNLNPVYARGGSKNYGKWSVPEIDRLAELQDRTLDPVQRKKLSQDLERAVINSAIAPGVSRWSLAIQFWQPYVRNMPWSPSAPLAYSNVVDYSRTWLDK